MDKDRALELLKKYIKNEKLIKHCIATGAIMREIAKELGEDEKRWELIGILHDIDYELVEGDMEKHGIVGAEILKKEGFDDDFCETIKRHNYHLFKAERPVEIALQSADNISGLIIACALVKKGRISDVTKKTVRDKFKEKSFARGCNREIIKQIERIGIDLDRFYEISIKALRDVKDELGLS